MKTVEVTLTIEVEGRPDYLHKYTKEVAENTADMKAISLTSAKGNTEDEKKANAPAYMVKSFNYGHDLHVRQNERQKAERMAQGPEKEIAKGVDFLVSKHGFTADAARAIIVAQREATGLPV